MQRCETVRASHDDAPGTVVVREAGGKRVAVSHARLDAVTRPAGVLARLKHPIAFEAIDGHPVDLVCLLLLPAGPQGAQLQALACVARTLRDADVLVRTRRAGDRDAVFAALTSKAA